MKIQYSFWLGLVCAGATAGVKNLLAGDSERVPSVAPVLAVEAASAPETGRTLAPLSAGRQLLIPVELERAVIERFRHGYAKLGKPKVALMVSRDPVVEGVTKSPMATLNAEAAFGRPFREAGVVLIKQSSSPEQSAPSGAELRMQIVITTKPYVWNGATLVVTNYILDASSEATMADGRVLGHAMTSDFVPANEAKAFLFLKRVGTEEVMKATALALMDDIMISLASNPTLADAVPMSAPPSSEPKLSGTEIPPPAQASLSAPVQPTSEATAKPPPAPAESPNSVAAATAGSSGSEDVAATGETRGRKPRPAPVATTSAESLASPSRTNLPSAGTSPSVNGATNLLTTAVLKGFVQKTMGEL